MSETELDNEIEKVYQEYWKPIIENKDGSLNLEQIKKELFDFHFMLEQVPQVYLHVTGNKLSKPNYYADSVIDAHNDHIEKLIEEELENFINLNSDGLKGWLPLPEVEQ